MCEGKSAQEIAIILGCSVYTVRAHRPLKGRVQRL
ncbi:hypothetical protein ACU8OK_27290 (plasmid) [Rhizobium leguminosarum]